jgi:hypothetical protein
MEKSPYDPSPEDAISRNEKRYKEELATFQANMLQIESYLEQAGMSMDEVRSADTESLPEKKPLQRLPRQSWVRI